MKKLIKVICIVFCLCFGAFIFVGCKAQNPLISSVSELRQDIFMGSNENFTIKGQYGFKENPYVNDGKASNRVYLLTFKLVDKEIEDVTYSISLDFNSFTYTSAFKLNPITHKVIAEIEIENFDLKEFKVKLCYGGNIEEIVMKSIVPADTISYEKALISLYTNQNNLISVYTDKDGNFNAEIYIRLVVKNDKSFWYIGIASGNNNLKALLIDGKTAEILAIRDIF